ncbi:hypothetical protein K493DRAFT_300734 [Basidiobolus meristosporus CBS 931.73]|uniref:Transmembrane protein n=1 Tax=Basidiobolus meristosporus CBS 931.73 TaxID=1314790 RepID=A0A1Y1YFF3_9FUNG|nr:hypothetical protein K493DRAFT_300734 [Basidiobolus meristosporus CBS 931.73]|eukprot:ORX96771.1 hypothetical protein K493DRAFT_300734 [Basidiobolus meristosporus CBS 931.73]
MGQSISSVRSPANRLVAPFSRTRNQQSPSQPENGTVTEQTSHHSPHNGSDTQSRIDAGNSVLVIDSDQTLWDRLVMLRASREILTARLRLFVRVSIIFVVLILVLGVDPLRLPWWLVFIPMILMILNLAYIATLKNRIRAIDREEVSLQQSMGRVEMGQDVEATYLPPPPPTYATAAAQPPAYHNPLLTPSYASLLPTRARSNLNLREQVANTPPQSVDSNNYVSIEMSQASSSSSGLMAPIEERRKVEEPYGRTRAEANSEQ